MDTSLASWISALAAVGALVAAIWAALSAKRLYQIESARDATAAQWREAEAARAMNAWMAVHLPLGPHDDHYEVGIVVANTSLSPLFEVCVQSTDREGREQYALDLRILPPGEYLAKKDPDYYWSLPDPVTSLPGLIRPISRNTN